MASSPHLSGLAKPAGVLRILGGTGGVHPYLGGGHRLREMKLASPLKLPGSPKWAPNTTSGVSQKIMPESTHIYIYIYICAHSSAGITSQVGLFCWLQWNHLALHQLRLWFALLLLQGKRTRSSNKPAFTKFQSKFIQMMNKTEMTVFPSLLELRTCFLWAAILPRALMALP